MNNKKSKRPSPGTGYDLIEKESHLLATMSRLAFARHLHNLYPMKSVKGWEMATQRWQKGNSVVNPEVVASPTTRMYSTDAYYYNTDEDLYFTFLRAADQVVKIEGDVHRQMKADYSNMATDALTINEMCRKYAMPRPWLEEYRKRHGWTHDMSPFTDEEFAEKDTDEMVKDLIHWRKKELFEKFEQARWKDLEKDASKWRNLNDHLLEEFLNLIPDAPEAPNRIELTDGEKPYALVVSATDFHWGKYGWVDEVGETYDFDEAKSRLMDRTQDLVSRLPYQPEKIIMGTGSDWFHVDNDLGTTTKGTPQDMCGTPAQILKSGCELAVEHIELLRQVAPVEIYNMAGNHDRMSALALIMYLDAYYRNADDVSVVVSPYPRQYMTYGNNLIGLTHGDKAMQKLPALMANEAKTEWGVTDHHYWFHGHLHHQTVKESAGTLIIQLASLAGHDRYHARAGYTMSKAGLSGYMIDKEEGLICSLFSPVEGH